MQFSRIIEDKTSKIKTKPKTQTSESRHDKETTKRSNTKIPNTSENGALPLDLNSKLASLKNLKTYDQLKSRCQKLKKDLHQLESNPLLINIMDERMEVDANSMDSYPNDVPDVRALYPCTVSSDGNCLPACGSVFAHKTEIYAAEMRLRIIIELVQNEDLYLNNDFLKKGLTNTRSKNLSFIYAQYSDMYVPGIHLTYNIVKDIYRKEVMKIRIDKTYMGIWQLHALASVLDTPIYSIYPKLGNPNVRTDLNRLIIPRENDNHKDAIYILWTSTRTNDMTNEHWVPNHFVPVLPIDNTRITLNGKSNEKKNGKVDEIEHDVTKESEKVIGDTEEDKMEVADDEKGEIEVGNGEKNKMELCNGERVEIEVGDGEKGEMEVGNDEKG